MTCAFEGCARDVPAGYPSRRRYCSRTCKERAKYARDCARIGGSYTVQVPDMHDTARIDRWLRALDAKRRRTTPRFGWQA